ncbi:DgyrCDS4118 [Dimorphilus gyrociliatus]|uniref:DgyrCDS4118 n=1 Tax=Dimorphilus gyrociliatus TaxID=2664684 RepID=A0A7I8VIL9_9ANNE|nr:DgyrCDS4118 [Dimorphilus gyrociliatus]
MGGGDQGGGIASGARDGGGVLGRHMSFRQTSGDSVAYPEESEIELHDVSQLSVFFVDKLKQTYDDFYYRLKAPPNESREIPTTRKKTSSSAKYRNNSREAVQENFAYSREKPLSSSTPEKASRSSRLYSEEEHPQLDPSSSPLRITPRNSEDRSVSRKGDLRVDDLEARPGSPPLMILESSAHSSKSKDSERASSTKSFTGAERGNELPSSSRNEPPIQPVSLDDAWKTRTGIYNIF